MMVNGNSRLELYQCVIENHYFNTSINSMLSSCKKNAPEGAVCLRNVV